MKEFKQVNYLTVHQQEIEVLRCLPSHKNIVKLFSAESEVCTYVSTGLLSNLVCLCVCLFICTYCQTLFVCVFAHEVCMFHRFFVPLCLFSSLFVCFSSLFVCLFYGLFVCFPVCLLVCVYTNSSMAERCHALHISVSLPCQSIKQHPVLVMELCTGRSLYEVIESPENAFGLCEDEFKTMMIDISKSCVYIRLYLPTGV